MNRTATKLLAGALLAFSMAGAALGQGQDGTPAERNLEIIEHLLPGEYDNGNQVYFDKRLDLPGADQRPRMHWRIEPVEMPSLGANVFRAITESGPVPGEEWLFSLTPEPNRLDVRMRFHHDGGPIAGCDLLWREEAGQFHARSEHEGCGERVPRDMMLAPQSLWVALPDTASHLVLDRARSFQCYLDVPGVGGGRDLPYKRYEIEGMHDRGGQQWIKLDDGSEVGLRLQVIRWPMNNLDGTFTRHSMVLYINQRTNGEVTETAYGWTVPDAPRIGINLKSMLANCFTISNEEVTPYYREEPTG